MKEDFKGRPDVIRKYIEYKYKFLILNKVSVTTDAIQTPVIFSILISDNVNIKEDEPRVLFVGQVHAEEVLGIEVILSLMNDLLDPRPEDYNHMNILKSYKNINLIIIFLKN